jgi:adenylate cyclase
MKARFLLIAVVVAAITVLGVVGLLAGQISGLLAAPAVLVFAIWMLRRVAAPSRWRRELREKDDLSALWLCQSGSASLIRRCYRRLPTDPRCRFCLGPFKGVGRVLGIRPSRKNPNFCPG